MVAEGIMMERDFVRAGLLKREEAMGKSSYERAEGALERRGY